MFKHQKITLCEGRLMKVNLYNEINHLNFPSKAIII